MRDFDDAWRRCISHLEQSGRRRELRPVERLVDGRLIVGGKAVIDFSSNDYLGLSQYPELIQRAREYTDRWGAGSCASRLVCGNIAPFEEVEHKLAAGKGSEAALIFVSGFQANSSILTALLDPQTLGAEPLVFSDKLNHASIIQGCLAAGVHQIRYRHNDLGHLAELLEKHRDSQQPRFILTETVFSMDGDRTDVVALRRLAQEHNAFLYLDEAHATGVLGEHGFGLASGMTGPDCLVMGTFSKALGGFGAYVAGTAAIREYLINRCPGLIFATALPPAVLGAMSAAIDLIPTLDRERARVAAHAERFRVAMKAAGLDTGLSSTQIVPVIVGSEEKALRIARRLESEGLLGVAIRPPTVPAGTSRIRFSMSARHDDGNIDRLIEAVIRLAREED